jgi:hypothetical protein
MIRITATSAGGHVLDRISILLSNIPGARHVVALAQRMDELGDRRAWLSENCVVDAPSLGGAIAATTARRSAPRPSRCAAAPRHCWP